MTQPHPHEPTDEERALHIEGYGIADPHIERYIKQLDLREITHQHTKTLAHVQQTLNHPVRIRLLQLPPSHTEYSAWDSYHSNLNTCLIYLHPDPTLHPTSTKVFIARHLAQHRIYTREGYPFFLPRNTPRDETPLYLRVVPLGPTTARLDFAGISCALNQAQIQQIFHSLAFLLQEIIADHALAQQGFHPALLQHYKQHLIEGTLWPKPRDLVEIMKLTADFSSRPDQVCLCLIRWAAAAVSSNLPRRVYQKVRERFTNLAYIVSANSPGFKASERFDRAAEYFRQLDFGVFRSPSQTIIELQHLLGLTDLKVQGDWSR